MSDVRKFWMVVRHDGGRAPKVFHPTREIAEEEAMRLCEKKRSTFYVVEAVSKFAGTFVGLKIEMKDA